MTENIFLTIAQHANYITASALIMIGLYIVISSGHFVKKIIGLNLFQNAVFLFYISIGKVEGGTIPILVENSDRLYSNPLPHVLILTAIVVGVSTMAVGLALCARVHEAFDSIEEEDIILCERQDERIAIKDAP